MISVFEFLKVLISIGITHIQAIRLLAFYLNLHVLYISAVLFHQQPRPVIPLDLLFRQKRQLACQAKGTLGRLSAMKTNQELLGPPLPFLSSKKSLIATTNLARLHGRASGRHVEGMFGFAVLFCASGLFVCPFQNQSISRNLHAAGGQLREVQYLVLCTSQGRVVHVQSRQPLL